MHLRLAFLPGLEPATRRSADQRATDRATREGFNCITFCMHLHFDFSRFEQIDSFPLCNTVEVYSLTERIDVMPLAGITKVDLT